jgi:peptidoglycan/LPS O-acetylase OafA/YrhL
MSQTDKKRSFFSLKRVVASGAYIAEIDGLRFIAIASVVVFHLMRMTEINLGDYRNSGNWIADGLHTLLAHGYFGVQLFFFISGFVLSLPYARHYLAGGGVIGYGTYLKRRVTRLEPPYIAELLLRYKPVMIAKNLGFFQLMPHFLASLVYMNAVFYRDYSVLLGVAWSLEIEIQFYLLAPFLARLIFQRRPAVRRTILLLLMVGSGFAQLAIPKPGYLLVHSLLFWDQYFFAGFLFADFYVVEFKKLRKHWSWDLLALALIPLFFWLNDHPLLITGATIVMLIGIAGFKGPAFSYFLSRHWIAATGGMCYSIYLTHSLVVQAAYRLVPHAAILHRFWPNLLVAQLVGLPLVFAVGAAFFIFIERPCMDKNWPQKLMSFLRREKKVAVRL